VVAYASWGIDSLLLSQARDVKAFAIGSRRLLVQNKTMTFELNRRAAQAWQALQRPVTRPQLVQRLAKRWHMDSDAAAREADDLLRVWKRYRLVRES
jgi:hypothetical protein